MAALQIGKTHQKWDLAPESLKYVCFLQRDVFVATTLPEHIYLLSAILTVDHYLLCFHDSNTNCRQAYQYTILEKKLRNKLSCWMEGPTDASFFSSTIMIMKHTEKNVSFSKTLLS